MVLSHARAVAPTFRTSLVALSTLLLSTWLAACSAAIEDEDADGPPVFQGAGGTTNANANPNQPAVPGANDPTNSNVNNGGGAATGVGTNNENPVTPIMGTSGSANTSPNSGNGTGGAGASTDPSVTMGGSSMGTAGTSALPPVDEPPVNPPVQPPVTPPVVTPPVVTPPVVQPPVVTPPTAPDIPCPADATFCSGFEGQTLPAATQFVVGGDSSFPNQFALDTSQSNTGEQSFMIPGPSPGFSYRALTIAAPGQDFWARLYVRVSSEFGDGNHDSLFGASSANQTSDHNNETLIELSEQFGYVLLNTDDCTLNCNAPSPQLQLAPDAWHCLEAHYDGNTGHVEVFLEGSRFIDATNRSHAFTYQTFRLGYMRFNTERTVWYDDVIVARGRVGCED